MQRALHQPRRRWLTGQCSGWERGCQRGPVSPIRWEMERGSQAHKAQAEEQQHEVVKAPEALAGRVMNPEGNVCGAPHPQLTLPRGDLYGHRASGSSSASSCGGNRGGGRKSG